LEDSDLITGDSALALDCGIVGQCGNRPEVILNSLSWAERSNVVLPFISSWARFLGLTQSLNSLSELQRLVLEHPSAQTCSWETQKHAEHLRRFLEKLDIQELTQLMALQEAPPSVQLSIDALAFQMQEEIQKLKARKQGTNMKRRR
jgi:hypothetical protein